MSITKSLAGLTVAALVAGCASPPPQLAKCSSQTGVATGQRGAFYSKLLTDLLASGLEVDSVDQASGSVVLVPTGRCGKGPKPTLTAEAQDVLKRIDSKKSSCETPPIEVNDSCMLPDWTPTPAKSN